MNNRSSGKSCLLFAWHLFPEPQYKELMKYGDLSLWIQKSILKRGGFEHHLQH